MSDVNGLRLWELLACSLAGSAACLVAWGYRALAMRSIRRPLLSAAVYTGLGGVFGLCGSLTVDLQWPDHVSGMLLASSLLGLGAGLFGPDVVIRWLAVQWETYQLARRIMNARDESNDSDDSKPE